MPAATDLTQEQLRAVDNEVQKALDLVVTVAARLSGLTERLDSLEERLEEERLTPAERARLENISGRAKNIH